MIQAQMQRKLDELGRIVLPIEMRQMLNMEEKDVINIKIDGKKIILEKAPQSQQEKKNNNNNNLSRLIVKNETLQKLGAKDTTELEVIEKDGQIILRKKEQKQETEKNK